MGKGGGSHETQIIRPPVLESVSIEDPSLAVMLWDPFGSLSEHVENWRKTVLSTSYAGKVRRVSLDIS